MSSPTYCRIGKTYPRPAIAKNCHPEPCGVPPVEVRSLSGAEVCSGRECYLKRTGGPCSRCRISKK